MARPQPFLLRLLSSFWFICLEILLLVFLLVSLVKQINRGYTLRREQTTLNENLIQERNNQADLQKMIALLASPTIQEKKIREHLGLQRAGEKVVAIEETESDTMSSGKIKEVTRSNYRLWWDYFLK